MAASGNLRAARLRELAERGDLKTFEEVWLEALDTAPTDVDAFLAGADALHARGVIDKASLYLSMLAPQLIERGLYAESLPVLRKMAALNPREKGIRQGLLAAYRALYAEHPGLPVFLDKSGLESGGELKAGIEKMETFLAFSPGRYLFHPAGWGAGRIVDVDAREATVVIDFEGRPGHRMSMEMAAKVTEFIEDRDLRALKFDRKDQLLAWAEEDPVELVRASLRSRRGKASLRDLRDRLTAGIIDPKAWSRWWARTRTRVKAALDISMTPGSNPTLELSADARTYAQTCVREAALLEGDSRRVRYFRDLLGEAAGQADGADAVMGVARVLLGPEPDAADGMDLGPRFSLACLLAEAAARFPGSVDATRLVPDSFASDPEALAKALPEIPIAGHRLTALGILRRTAGPRWAELWRALILRGEPDSADACLHELLRHGHEELARAAVATALDRYREFPHAYLWYLRLQATGRAPAELPREEPPTLLEKALLLHDHLAVIGFREDAEDMGKVMKGLVSVMQSRDYSVVREAFTAATDAEARNLASLLRNNRSLHRDTRDQMLAHMFRKRPDLGRTQAGIQAETTQDPLFDPGTLYCTEASLLRKRIEFEDLVNRQIPENAAEIGRAASYGDLSENSEWSAAIEKQARLTRLSEELAAELAKARIIQPGLADPDEVSLGSRVLLRDEQGQRTEFTILGPWELDLDRGFISYMSPIGRALLRHRTGDRVRVEGRTGTVTYEILDIADGLSAAERNVTASG
jgi:transcription elongation factor GreA